MDRGHRLSAETEATVVETLKDFRALALGAARSRSAASPSAALRDAENGPALMERLRAELGFPVEVIEGQAEARYGFLGGVRGLPVEHGLLFDLGGGSLQVTRFFQRTLDRAWSLPLGSLRLSQSFLLTDPPAEDELRRLRKHVRRSLEDTGVPALRPGEELVGTGGTVRNLAKIDARARGYPIARVHGYVLARDAAREVTASLASRRLEKRERIPGLSGDRGDSIVGGAVAIETLMGEVGAPHVRVSGQGVREGFAYSLLGEGLPSPAEVRTRSVASSPDASPADAATRAPGGGGGCPVERPRSLGDPVREALGHAARVLDVVARWTSSTATSTPPSSCSPPTSTGSPTAASRCSPRSCARRGRGRRPGAHSPLLPEDHDTVERAAVILALADDLEERCPPGAPVDLSCRLVEGGVVVEMPSLAGWRRRALDKRFARAFGRELVVRPGAAAPGRERSPSARRAGRPRRGGGPGGRGPGERVEGGAGRGHPHVGDADLGPGHDRQVCGGHLEVVLEDVDQASMLPWSAVTLVWVTGVYQRGRSASDSTAPSGAPGPMTNVASPPRAMQLTVRSRRA